MFAMVRFSRAMRLVCFFKHSRGPAETPLLKYAILPPSGEVDVGDD
jgi:hypothetical protein